ncbi:MAG TPA: 2-C-methyl-D-erythritol 4-phosphate cytidylyltransferase, partial [Chryseolinea sp.]|nr:2-C-methyl-D-erythritol 4-phosphate cytidylyltransferase [Chryseolinea sp.]
MHSTQYALIVAGGKGTRIPGNIPKQFIELNGLPVLMHTVNAFYAYSDDIHIILVLPADDFVAWDALCKLHQFQRPILLQPGGSTRFQSVKLGLSRIEGEGIVAIHDGVRPMVTPEIIKKSFDLAEQNRSAVASVALKESIRRIDSGKTSAL